MVCTLTVALVSAAAPKEAILRVWVDGTFDLHFKLAEGWVATRSDGEPRDAPIDSMILTSATPKKFVLDVAPKPEHAATLTNLERVRDINGRRHQQQGIGEVLTLEGPHVRGVYYAQQSRFVWNKEFTEGFAGYLVVDGKLPVQFGISYNAIGRKDAIQALETLRTISVN
jgi:hypothetical protein